MKRHEGQFLCEGGIDNLDCVLRSALTHFKAIGGCPDISFIDWRPDGNYEIYNPWGLRRLRRALKAPLIGVDCMQESAELNFEKKLYLAMAKAKCFPKHSEILNFLERPEILDAVFLY
jgi:hypothetical protein